jgi:hypothetical protein
LEVVFEAVKALFPELAVFVDPSGSLAERIGFEFAGTPLGFATAGDECLETAGMLISKGSASSVTEASPRARRARMARRVGSASAEKVELMESFIAY